MKHRDDNARVVVTGMGVVCRLGQDLDSFWSGLRAGRSCVRQSPDLDPRIAAKIVADFGDFSLDDYFAAKKEEIPERYVTHIRRLVRGTPFGLRMSACAALQAFLEADAERAIPRERAAHVCAGQNLSNAYGIQNLRAFREHPDDIEPLFGITALDTDTVVALSELLDLRGPGTLVAGACAAGNLAIITALDLIRCGRADLVLVTGAPLSFDSMLLHGTALIDAVSYQSFNDTPERASRPFDRRREGFVPSETAAALVLESLASARTRGAAIRAEILGGSSTSDACRLPKPHEDGQVRAITGALADAGITASEVDYVNAHATSTQLGDAIEVSAIKQALGQRAYEIPINSTKSMIGHGVTSAGVVEMVATLLQMEHGIVHPTINQEDSDPALDLDFVPNVAREYGMRTAVSNSFGFGGINSCVVVRKW